MAGSVAWALDPFTVIRLPTVRGGEVIVVDSEAGPARLAVGMAVDEGGKIYVSDRGRPDEDTGKVFLVRGTNTPAVVFQTLAQPADIEMMPDQRGLVIARPGGGVQLQYFGVTADVTGNNVPLGAVVYLKTDLGVVVGHRHTDGFFHFPGVMRPEQVSTTAILVINNTNPPEAREISLADPATGRLVGEAFVTVEFNR